MSSSATCGAGSKVWLLVPSGTMPSMSTLSPPMLAAIEVIGATVVATLSWPSLLSSLLHPVSTRADTCQGKSGHGD